MHKPLILIVEDDPPIRSLISIALQSHNYRLITSANAENAVMEASSHNPDIVLLDLGLPDLDGVEVIRKIRSWSNMPIIVISARSDDSDKIEALDAGADDSLTKPFNILELKARIRAILRRSSIQNQERTENRLTRGQITIDTERFNDYKKAIQAKLVKACGEHKYWSVWAAEIAEVVQTQIKRITALLNAKDSPYEEDFVRFHETLKDNLNKTGTRDEAIAMLAQQLVSAPVFDALFSDYQFIRNNPISKSLETLLARLDENIDGKDRQTLENFYESVRHKASDKTTAAQKQAIVVQLYNNFFNIAFKEIGRAHV